MVQVNNSTNDNLVADYNSLGIQLNSGTLKNFCSI
ncbi:hypothetical protein pb186bvf_003322 [Paramecium bursaria]